MPEERSRKGFQKSARYSGVVIAFSPTGTHFDLAQLVFLIATLLVPAGMVARYWVIRKKTKKVREHLKTVRDQLGLTGLEKMRWMNLAEGLAASETEPGGGRIDLKAWFRGQIDGAPKGSPSIDALGPFPAVQRVRKALLAGQLDSVRNLLSDPLYQRLKASPPPAQPPGLILVTKRQVDDDPDRVKVLLSRGVTVSGAAAEEWTMLRLSQAATTPSPVMPAANPEVPQSVCSYCGTSMDPGSNRCRSCGMDVALAPSRLPPAHETRDPTAGVSTPPSPGPHGWIVEDIRAAGPMAP
ncbi:MAG: zinc ribbon domain-containing protein [Candidatus Dormibacteraeota bacterium]|nr:zinc ribbon domain-containing protein [Candidatus Dormibacteraeota bacterium]